nr:MAG TPA: hypothetical protein [Caudoviricetes sp.]
MGMQWYTLGVRSRYNTLYTQINTIGVLHITFD